VGRGGISSVDNCKFFYEKGNDNHYLGTVFSSKTETFQQLKG
jgi:hypothetical protein